jgi:hypothetical protein
MTDSKHICNICNKALKTPNCLIAHLKNLHKDKPTIITQEIQNIRQKQSKNKSTKDIINPKDINSTQDINSLNDNVIEFDDNDTPSKVLTYNDIDMNDDSDESNNSDEGNNNSNNSNENNQIKEFKKMLDVSKFPKGSRLNPNKIIIDTNVCEICNITFKDVDDLCKHLNSTICGRKKSEKDTPSSPVNNNNIRQSFKERLAQELQKYPNIKTDSDDDKKINQSSIKKKHLPYTEFNKEDWYNERKIRYTTLVNTVKSFFYYTIDMVDVLADDNNYLDNETTDILKARIRQCINIMDL